MNYFAKMVFASDFRPFAFNKPSISRCLAKYAIIISTRGMTFMANTIQTNPLQPDMEALKKFAETPPLQPIAPHQEVSSDQADKEALSQYAKEKPPLAVQPNILAPQETAPVGPMPTEAEVKALEKDQVAIEVEKLLEKDLANTYTALPDKIKPFFKSHGEKIAQTVTGMIKNNTFDGGIVMDMVDEWLKLVPKSNSFYLEQEAKLKTDALVKYAENAIKNAQNNVS